MPGRVGVDLPAVALWSDEVLLQCRAELDDAALFGLDFGHFEVEVVLLGVFVVGPARSTGMPLSSEPARSASMRARSILSLLLDHSPILCP